MKIKYKYVIESNTVHDEMSTLKMNTTDFHESSAAAGPLGRPVVFTVKVLILFKFILCLNKYIL